MTHILVAQNPTGYVITLLGDHYNQLLLVIDRVMNSKTLTSKFTQLSLKYAESSIQCIVNKNCQNQDQ